MARSSLGNELLEVVKNSSTMTTQEFLDSLNPIIIKVEIDETYKTNRKLKIFNQFTMISNCEPKERMKYAKKLARLL